MNVAVAAKSRLALGTVQFGMHYGIANQQGQVSLAEAARIIAQGRAHGLDTLDTASAYGESEARLGEIGVGSWHVVSKLPPLPHDCPDVLGWVEYCATASLERLRLSSLYGLLVHRSADLSSVRGVELFDAMQGLKARAVVRKLGVSVYAPEELDVIERFPLELVQAPFNVFDRRLQTSGWLACLKARRTEVHTRSAFLQGLLLAPPERRPAAFARWQGLWEAWDRWLAETGCSRTQASLGFALRYPEIDRVVVGVDSAAQLAMLLGAQIPLPQVPPDVLSSRDLDLIDPSRWSQH
jgi:aryl-alcohol dehydrogenase-like predicted oxidoreductase